MLTNTARTRRAARNWGSEGSDDIRLRLRRGKDWGLGWSGEALSKRCVASVTSAAWDSLVLGEQSARCCLQRVRGECSRNRRRLTLPTVWRTAAQGGAVDRCHRSQPRGRAQRSQRREPTSWRARVSDRVGVSSTMATHAYRVASTCWIASFQPQGPALAVRTRPGMSRGAHDRSWFATR